MIYTKYSTLNFLHYRHVCKVCLGSGIFHFVIVKDLNLDLERTTLDVCVTQETFRLLFLNRSPKGRKVQQKKSIPGSLTNGGRTESLNERVFNLKNSTPNFLNLVNFTPGVKLSFTLNFTLRLLLLLSFKIHEREKVDYLLF